MPSPPVGPPVATLDTPALRVDLSALVLAGIARVSAPTRAPRPASLPN